MSRLSEAALIVLVTDVSSEAERLRSLFGVAYRVFPVHDWQAALARISAGDVDLVVLPLLPGARRDTVWNMATAIYRSTTGLPIVIVCDAESGDPGIPQDAFVPLVLVVREPDLAAIGQALIWRRRARRGAVAGTLH